ncbi:MAPEG family protein [Microbulbifer guangxiensis]|uniref:MAPEG family protein n=1 Tax=Microbulbifer guangxiensis TaxID=2904249 RepID=UPI001F3177F4|nr:MAPEG family protein [Microbulbifer guangxiensis]
MPNHSPILLPVVALVAWSLLMWIWMYATRLPAIRAAGLELDSTAPQGTQMQQLPARVRWKADNYNHLMEQPTLFYAIALVLALVGQSDGLNLILTWVYVVTRVIHSLFQALVNRIEIRFVIFVLSSMALFALTVRAIMALT